MSLFSRQVWEWRARGDAAVDGGGEGKGLLAVFDVDARMFPAEPFGGAVIGAVVDDDNLIGRLREQGREEAFEQFAAVAGGDDDRDAGGECGARRG